MAVFGALKGAFTGNATSIGTSAPLNTLASGSAVVEYGDLIYAVFGEEVAPTTTTVGDNLGNIYAATQVATDAGTSTGHAYWARVTNPGTITAITAVANGGTNNFAGAALLIQGPLATSPLDKNPTNITTDVTSPFTCPSSTTLTQAQEIVIGWSCSTGSAVWAATSPNLLGAQIATAAVLSVRIGYQAVAATTAVLPEFTGTNPTDGVLGTTTFMRQAAFTAALFSDIGAEAAAVYVRNPIAVAYR